MDEVEAFRRSTARRRNIKLGLLALVIASPFLYLGVQCRERHARIDKAEAEYRKSLELTDAEVAALKLRIGESRQQIAAARAAWASAVTPAALAALEPGEVHCRVSLHAPTQAAESYIPHGSIDGNYFGAGSYLYGAGAPIPDEALASAAATIEEAAARVAANKADRNDIRRVEDLPDTAIFIVADERSEPVVTTSATGIGSFLPGHIGGRAFVYDVFRKAIVCTADIDVRNSESIKFDFSYMEGNYLDEEIKMREAATTMLVRDLRTKVRQALAKELRDVRASAGSDGSDAAGSGSPPP